MGPSAGGRQQPIAPSLCRQETCGNKPKKPVVAARSRTHGGTHAVAHTHGGARAQLAAGVRSSYDGQCKHTWLEALRASSAAPYFFDEYVLGEGDEEMRFQDGAIVANNPCVLALQEAQCLWPGRPVDVVVSVGTGR